ncbi:acetyl esterase [Actinoplanes octamycinicus]|uniref:Acetyl esterase n=1 Tax=Actinoplanes octamycinicus TaxID=135948 RepID=A0A7W7H6X9_9ACTN|nr:alpha/beta hydrolase [Actinoplanes octamycinicus]MBB4745059.1 acetyl esterase [Actinoplanes octamycinicus]GIE55645.1 alpha/beta hydrolase [Actinoplanes octamycinicus]
MTKGGCVMTEAPVRETVGEDRPPLVVRLLDRVRSEPDWAAMSAAELAALQVAENRKRASRLMRLITGWPQPGVTITWERVSVAGREVTVRVHRPDPGRARTPAGAAPGTGGLPLVVHVHGGGFVGTAAQSDWITSAIAAWLPAVVVSVEHRLVSPEVPLLAGVDDAWDVLGELFRHAARWGVDPGRVALAGESAGAAITGTVALRARDAGLALRAQVLVNPCTDLTATALDYPSMREHPDSPTLTLAQMRFFQRMAVPDGTDPRAVSPLHAWDVARLAPALIVVPTVDPLADQGRAYAERLRIAGTPVRLTEHRGATHAFVSMPGLLPQARAAREEIIGFLRERLS